MLLRAIQERKIRKKSFNMEIPIDVRIIAATNENLKSLSKDSSFKEDLYLKMDKYGLN